MSLELQKEIVQGIVNSVSSKWDRITADIEVDEVYGESVMSPDYRFHNKEESIQFDTDMETEELIEDLRDIMQKNDSTQSYWTVCYIEVDPSGGYSFKFSYDEPPRLTKLKNS
jgi:hypothetical protein